VATLTFRHRKPLVTLGRKTVQLGAGQHRIVRIELNATGRRLLAVHRKLSTMLQVTQATGDKTTVILDRPITFRAPGARAR
jgi:hypothetical protein